jgi:hypothetical protein
MLTPVVIAPPTHHWRQPLGDRIAVGQCECPRSIRRTKTAERLLKTASGKDRLLCEEAIDSTRRGTEYPTRSDLDEALSKRLEEMAEQ